MGIQALRRWRFGMRQVLGGYAAVFLPFAHLRSRLRADPHPLSPCPVGSGTQIVIDGFPRSGNTFAVSAFLLSQERPVSVAHHLHVPAQILAGVRRGIPVILLIRDPAAAVLSMCVREPVLSLSELLSSYSRFHLPLLSVDPSKLLVADFGEVTEDFGGVLRRANALFGTSFGVFEHTEQGVSRCFSLIEERNRGLSGGSVVERGIARPSIEREGLKTELLDQLNHPALSGKLAQCRELHSSLRDGLR